MRHGTVDSDYVFVNLWAGRISQPMTDAAVHKLVARLQAQGSRKPRRSTSYRA